MHNAIPARRMRESKCSRSTISGANVSPFINVSVHPAHALLSKWVTYKPVCLLSHGRVRCGDPECRIALHCVGQWRRLQPRHCFQSTCAWQTLAQICMCVACMCCLCGGRISPQMILQTTQQWGLSRMRRMRLLERVSRREKGRRKRKNWQ